MNLFLSSIPYITNKVINIRLRNFYTHILELIFRIVFFLRLKYFVLFRD